VLEFKKISKFLTKESKDTTNPARCETTIFQKSSSLPVSGAEDATNIPG